MTASASPSPDSYRNDSLYVTPTIQEMSVLIAEYQEAQPDHAAADSSDPLTNHEVDITNGLLRYIDSHLPRHDRQKAKSSTIRQSVMAAKTALANSPVSDIDIDDLTQEARIATIGAARRVDPERGSIYRIVSLSIISRLKNVSSRSLMGGFTTHRGPTKKLSKPVISLTHLREILAASSPELGFSDHLEEMRCHPLYTPKVELAYSEPTDETDDRFLPYEQRALEPGVMAEDAEAANWLELVELPLASNLDRIFAIADNSGQPLTSREMFVLRCLYEQGLSMEKVGKLPELNITRQSVSQINRSAQLKLRQSSSEALQDLRRSPPA